MSEVIDAYNCELPNDWEMKTIDDLATRVGSGITPRGGSDEYKDDGTIFIRSQNVQFAGLDLLDVAFIDEKTHQSMRASEVLPFDVLLNITGASIGRCCYVPDGLGQANQNQHVCTIRLPDPNRDDSKYLSSVFASPIGQYQIIRLNAGGNREGLNYQQLRSFRIPWPATPVRAKIARILTTVDNQIEKTEALIEKYKAIKQGMMHDLFTRGVDQNGKLRPPYEEAPHLYKESPLGWIPKEWDTDQLQNKTRQIIDGTHHTPTYIPDGVPFLRVTDIQTEDVDFKRLKYISAAEHRVLAARVLPKRGDLLLSKNGTIGIPKIVNWDWEFSIFVSLALIRPIEDELPVKYLEHLIQSDIVWRQIRQRSKQGTVTNLHLEEIRELVIPLPDTKEMTWITERLDIVNCRIRSESNFLEFLSTLKTGLMQDLLTGKVRVKVEEVEEELTNA